MDPIRDEGACARIVFEVADALDARDDRRLGECLRYCTWTHEGTGRVFVGTRGAEQLSHEYLGARLGVAGLQHDVTNVLIDVGQDGLGASATAEFAVLAAVDSSPLEFVLAGRYRDTFRQINGRWRLLDRVENWDLVAKSFHDKLEPTVDHP
jgi:hypothetical protein